MWPTSEGDRTLQGSEATLLAHAIDTLLDPLVDYLCTEDESEQESFAAVLQTGISVFDALSIGQRIAVLHQAAHYLLTDSPFPCEALSAADDATIAAIYGEVRDRVEIEIDCSNTPTDSSGWPPQHALGPPSHDGQTLLHWRRLVHEACRDTLGGGHWLELETDAQLARLPLGEWELWIDALASAILWDRDFEFADSFLDADPDSARQRRRVLGIADDYFVRPAPDPSHRHTLRLINQTRQLVRSVHRDSRSDARPLEDDPIS